MGSLLVGAISPLQGLGFIQQGLRVLLLDVPYATFHCPEQLSTEIREYRHGARPCDLRKEIYPRLELMIGRNLRPSFVPGLSPGEE